VQAGEVFPIKATIDKEVAHPNTTEHHFRRISIYFQPEGENFPYQIGRFESSAHGESTKGPDTSSIYTHHEGIIFLKTDKSGTLYTTSMCNIHGSWQSEKELKISQV
jgi:superoxide reductase